MSDMNRSMADAAVLAYYGREAGGQVETVALAGLPLSGFRAARGRLISRGALIRSLAGRYVPVTA